MYYAYIPWLSKQHTMHSNNADVPGLWMRQHISWQAVFILCKPSFLFVDAGKSTTVEPLIKHFLLETSHWWNNIFKLHKFCVHTYYLNMDTSIKYYTQRHFRKNAKRMTRAQVSVDLMTIYLCLTKSKYTCIMLLFTVCHNNILHTVTMLTSQGYGWDNTTCL